MPKNRYSTILVLTKFDCPLSGFWPDLGIPPTPEIIYHAVILSGPLDEHALVRGLYMSWSLTQSGMQESYTTVSAEICFGNCKKKINQFSLPIALRCLRHSTIKLSFHQIWNSKLIRNLLTSGNALTFHRSVTTDSQFYISILYKAEIESYHI